MTRLWHFGVCAVVVGDEAYTIREQRGIPLGFSPVLWKHGFPAWLESTRLDDGLSVIEARELMEREGGELGLFAMRPLGSTTDPGSGSSFRIDAAEEFQRVTSLDAPQWLAQLRQAWPGPLVCGIGSQPREFHPAEFIRWTAPLWGIGAAVSFDASSGEAEGSPIHTCLTASGVRNRVLIERAPRRDSPHWHGLPIFGLHRGAHMPDRVPLEEWPEGSIVRIEHRDHVPDGSGGWTGERTPTEILDVAVECLRANPGIGVALDVTRLSQSQLARLAEVA
ncbi:MAG: hypothetical protein KIS87_08890 [Phycisphaeraceae bacterium]|nr:hypothetical protein [Phycisphaeraceae bacterium]